MTALAIDRPHDDGVRRYSHAMELGSMRAEDDIETAFGRGDADALRAVYDAHGALVYTFCARTLGADAARDVTQETFLAAWRARERFDTERGTLAGWLIGIAKNKIIDHLRANGRRVPTVAGGDIIESIVGPDAVGDLGERMLVGEAIRTLPDRARLVVEMAFFEDLTHAQIAERTDLPLGTIKSDIRRGLARMRRHLEEGR